MKGRKVAETECELGPKAEKKMLKEKGARTGCVKKPGGKKLPACGANLVLQGLERGLRYTSR